MIDKLQVTHFKSIRQLDLAPRRVNVFIGKPNTGKSNILESLGILSFPSGDLKELVRFELVSNLFYDHDLSKSTGTKAGPYNFELAFREGRFFGTCNADIEVLGLSGRLVVSTKDVFSFQANYDGTSSYQVGEAGTRVKFYKFSVQTSYPKPDSDFLLPPHGTNLLALLLSYKDLKRETADLLREFGYRLVLKPQEHKLEIQKEVDDVVVSTPYPLVSDTLQRVIFHLAAIETNKDSTLIFEEPESHAFPFYTKLLAERIALDAHNQYFLATHNPYFLTPLVEKTKAGDLAVFVTYYENYETKVKALSDEEVTKVLDLDESVFFNLDKFLSGK